MNLYNLHAKPESLDHHAAAQDSVPSIVWEKYRDDAAELKKREAALAKDSEIAYRYARNILQGKFPAGEAVIATDEYWSYQYAFYVLKDRFPAGEAAIARNPEVAKKYNNFIGALK